ncbi:MAG: hypothetical protein U5N53_12150 [Mycobacterium sp.]|nr:hypothetical protein [Mycobacterium sp.]
MSAPQTTDSAEALTRWRYWLITPELLRRPRAARLLPGDPKDQAVWGSGLTVAVCRRDPSHRPPHPGCSCGLRGINGANIQHGSAARQWVWDSSFGGVWTAAHGGRWSAPPRPSSIAEQVRFMRGRARRTHLSDFREWMRKYSPLNQFVVGRVQLHNAALDPGRMSEDGGVRQHDSWRAESATLDSLYIEKSTATNDAHCDADELAAALRDLYEVPCQVGYPAYTQEDWDARTIDLGETQPTWEQLGLYAPGHSAPTAKPAPSRMFAPRFARGQDRRPFTTQRRPTFTTERRRPV